MRRAPRGLTVTAARLAAAPALAAALAAVAPAAGCAEVRDVALEVHPASDAQQWLASDDPVRAVLAAGALDCGAPYATPIAALCVQVYTLDQGRIVMEASCHDAPGLASDADLKAFLRGLGPVAADVASGDEVQVYVRLLGYSTAGRAADSLVMCGITPSFPGHVDESVSPPTLALYLLCHAPDAAASAAGTVFGDYCASSDFVAIFP